MSTNKKYITGTWSGDKLISKYVDMLTNRLKEIKASDWKKGWMGVDRKKFEGKDIYLGFPQNLRGGHYNGSNLFFLFLDASRNNYHTPIYLTEKQAKDLGVWITDIRNPMPISFYDTRYYKKETAEERNYRMKSGKEKAKSIDWKTWKDLPKEERDKYSSYPILRAFFVYNIDQTDMEKVKPELYNKQMSKFYIPQEFKDSEGMYVNKALDHMIENQDWACRFKTDKYTKYPCYNVGRDVITIPEKAQYKIGKTPDENYVQGQVYYATIIHEMFHSLGIESRLNRKTLADYSIDDKAHAKEELSAEMSSAVFCYMLGFDAKIDDRHVAYFSSWLQGLDNDPKYLRSILSDVKKGVDQIIEVYNKECLAVGMKPLMEVKDEKEKTKEQSEDKTLKKSETKGKKTTQDIPKEMVERKLTPSKVKGLSLS